MPGRGESEPDRASDRFLTGDVILHPAGAGRSRPTIDPSSDGSGGPLPSTGRRHR